MNIKYNIILICKIVTEINIIYHKLRWKNILIINFKNLGVRKHNLKFECVNF